MRELSANFIISERSFLLFTGDLACHLVTRKTRLVKKPKVMLVVVKVVVMAVVLAVFSFKLQIVVVGVVVCFMHRLLW